MASTNTLHDAVDAALAAQPAAELVSRGLAELAASNDQLTTIGETLVRMRAELYEREEQDSNDPLIARERFFVAVDYDAVYRQLVARGAALPQRVFWEDLASRLRDGGARAGLRLLDRHIRELQSDLRTFIAEVETMRASPPRHLALALHDTSLPVATLVMGFTRFLTTCTYLSILCERASQLHEGQLAERETAALAS